MPEQALARKTFTFSRLAEFASEAELVKQIGHDAEDWPLVVLKELVDNALDAAEEAGTAPSIEVAVDKDSITVADNGSGMPEETIASIADYVTRTSSRAAYVSPTRGAQGNALQSIIPMGFALDGERGETVIESRGVAHRMAFTVNPVRQTPRVDHERSPSSVKTGTRVMLRWPDSASSILEASKDDFLQLVSTFAWLNPHLTLSCEWCGSDDVPVLLRSEATDPDWMKWRPNMPTSPHWYDVQRLSRLMAAEIAHAEDNGIPCPTVREFVSSFRGLSATAKAKAIGEAIGASRQSLADFHSGGEERVKSLLEAMQASSNPVKPRDLGSIGREHLITHFAAVGVDPETFDYRVSAFEHLGLPYVIEAAFGYAPSRKEEGRVFVSGLNFSPAIGANPFRNLGAGRSLDGLLAQQWADRDEPVVVFAHLTSPRLNFLDKGKTQVALPGTVANALMDVARGVTQRWAKQRRAEERAASAKARRSDALSRKVRPLTLKQAAWGVMAQAYAVASDNGRLPANPRQIYYAARGAILESTGKTRLDSSYFTQTLLVDYIEERGVAWDIVWDDRGHFREPHTGHEIGLGTLAVRNYLNGHRDLEISDAAIAQASISTRGPAGRYGTVLFLEKEGFQAILEAARIPERFDVAVMSTKGMSVTAARQLVDELCGKRGLGLLLLHDFDIAGFSIKKTLTESGRRYQFASKVQFVDLGLRLADVERLGLESEPFVIDRDEDALRARLKINGANEDEIEFLIGGERVELNAMTSNVFVDFVEEGLVAAGVTKVVPSKAILDEAYGAFKRGTIAEEALEAEFKRLNEESVTTPADLIVRVERHLTENPEETWDEAVREIVEQDCAGAQP